VTRLVVLSVLGLAVAFALATGEAALQRMSRVRAAELLDEGRAGARALVRVVGDSAAYLSVLTFVRILAETVVAVMVTFAVLDTVEGTWQPFLVAVGIMVVASFVLVGVSPRTLGVQHTSSLSLVAAPVAIWLRRLLGPLSRLLVALANAVTPGQGYRDGPFESESELRDLVDLARESSLIEAGEREMIHSVFELGDTLTREVMVPRTDMVTIDADRTCRQALNLSLRSGYSRIPVVGEDSDDVLGLLYLKDVVRRVHAGPGGAEVPVTEVMRPMPFVPESKRVDELLREMQRDQTHFALVVDEYGGTAGLVTIEDIIEEIVGEIADEYDREDPEVEDLGGGRVRVDATMDIDDLADHFGVEIDEDEVDTVGGLIGKTIGRVPIVGSTCEVAGLRLTAERMAGRRHRLASIIVERVEPADAQARRADGDDERVPAERREVAR
jgi:CBS domain containing-hemolysin-like protein